MKATEAKVNLHKYTGVSTTKWSNKYDSIVDIEDKENTYIIFANANGIENAHMDSTATITYSNSKELYIVKPENSSREKPYFFKAWATIANWDAYYTSDFIIVKAYWDADKEELSELAKGCDDVWNLEQFCQSWAKNHDGAKFQIKR